MKQTKRKPLLNRNETKTLLTTLKLATAAGALSLTVAGWGLLAHFDGRDQALAANQPVAIVASAQTGSSPAAATPPPPPPSQTDNTSKQVFKLDVVQWVQDVAGDQVAVVRDNRGTLWYVMGSDVPRIEHGQAPVFQPQPVRLFGRTTAS